MSLKNHVDKRLAAIRPVTAIFSSLIVGLLLVTVGYWQLVLEPRLQEEAQAVSRAIAQVHGMLLTQYLQQADVESPGFVTKLEGQLQSLRSQLDKPTGRPLVHAISLELADGGLIGEVDEAACPECRLSDIALYDTDSNAFMALMRVQSDPAFDEAIHQNARRGLFAWGAMLLVLLLAAWRIALSFQDRVRETEGYARAMFEGSPLPLMLVSEMNYSVRSINRAATDLLGEVTELPEPLQLVWAQMATDPMARHVGDAELETANGTLRPVLVHISALQLDGRKVLAVALVDISERKRFEQQMRRARDKAESASRTKGAFLAAMSHEVRTPLHGILGFTDLLARNMTADDQLEYLRLIRLSATNLLDVIEDILDFSRIEAGKLEVHKEPFDLNATLRDSLALFEARAKEKGLELNLTLGEGLQEPLNSDAKRVAQIVGILIDNAIKFTEQGAVQVLLQADEKRLRLSVIDTGIGILPENLDHLFEPFYQVDQGTARSYGGTGLGLVIASNLAQRLGGEIRVRSELGAGSRFSLMLPLAERN